MKKAIVRLTIILSIIFPAGLTFGQVKTVFFATNSLPPPNGAYISPAQWHALYANGIIISNVIHRGFLPGLPPPPPGTSATHTFSSGLDFDLSLDQGASFTHVSAPAIVSVNVQNLNSFSGGTQTYGTEMIQLDISGGTLPGTLMIRESPTLHSTGQTMVSPTPGGYLINSFFDIFTEVSTDGGQSWSPSTVSGHMDLRADAGLIPPTTEPSPLLPPPNDQYVSPAQYHALYAAGIVIKDVRHKFFTSYLNPLTLPVGTNRVTEQFNSTVDCQLSLDGGNTFNPMRTPAMVTVALQKTGPGSPAGSAVYVPQLFDTEMIQLDISGGTLPTNIRLRESPTLASYGGTSVLPMSDGTFKISSFFDIFTELSTDGGNTWQPQSNAPAHVELQRIGFQYQYPSPNLPPTNGAFLLPSQTLYANGVIVSNVTVRNPSPSQPPPPPGQSQPQTFVALADLMVSTDGGRTFSNATAQANALVMISNSVSSGAAQYYSAELMQLNISGGNLPPGIMLRESPSKASLGRTSITPIAGAGGGFRIDSFFDVFTELSADGGQTWSQQLSPVASVALLPYTPPGIVRLAITCPSDLTVNTGDPSGAVVNYGLPPQFTVDCPLLPVSISCVPPAGSKFPLGTTIVHCTRTDGCGEIATCTFNVTVQQSFIYYAGLAHTAIGNAVLSVGGTGAPASSLTISNLSSSGQDGVHLNLGLVDSVLVNFVPFPTTYNTCVVTIATGPYAAASSAVLGIGTYYGGTNPMVSADFSAIGATSLLGQVMDESNHLVQAFTIPNAAWVNINNLFPPPCTNYGKTAYSYAHGTNFIWYRFCIYGCNCLGTNCYIERVLCLRPDLAFTAIPKALSGLDLRSQGASPPITLGFQSVQVGKFGNNMHATKGFGTFESQPGFLSGDNLGTSGNDGLAVDLKNVSNFDMTLAPLRELSQGACLKLTAFGLFNGQTNVELGLATLTHSVGPGGGCDVGIDFSSIGASQARIDVYEGSQLIGTTFAPTGSVGTLNVNGNIIGCGKLPIPLPCFWMRFDSQFLFIPKAGPSMSGDQIRILAANPLGQVQGISQFCLQGCNLGQATIVTESNPPPLEVDTFPLPQAQMTLAIPIPGDGTRMETVNLAGSAVVQTTIGMGGETGDSNNNGLDDAPTVMTSLNLSGSSSLGTVLVTLDPSQPTLGMIEEQTNKFRGVLDLPPFAVSGTASSYFDIFFDVTIGGVVLHSAKPAHMAAIITHKPPGPGDTFNSTNTMPIDLLSTNGQASGYQFISGTFVPNCVPPRITVSSVANGRATFCWPALCGTAFQVQCATNLIPPIGWQPLTNAVLTTNGLYCVSVTLTNGSRFYRLAR